MRSTMLSAETCSGGWRFRRGSGPRSHGFAYSREDALCDLEILPAPSDVIIPLVPPFEREVFKAPDCFLLRHRSTDHRGRKIECEVLRAAFREEINRSVDKGRGPRTALPWHPLSKSAAGSRRGRRRSTSQDFISVRPTIPTENAGRLGLAGGAEWIRTLGAVAPRGANCTETATLGHIPLQKS